MSQLTHRDCDRLRRQEWAVHPYALDRCKSFIQQHHYSKGCSNTAVYSFALLPVAALDGAPRGVTLWLPPTKNAARSVNAEQWTRVLSLSRMAVEPGVPKNACSFMLSRAVHMIRMDGRFVSLVTFADESQEHTGAVYRASGWTYVGRVGPYPRWVEPTTGRQVATQATRTRTVSQMTTLGYVRSGSFHKHKYVKHLTRGYARVATDPSGL